MGKGKSKRQWNFSKYQAENQSVLESLKLRATDRCTPLGHELGIWSPAKRKHGQNAVKALCKKCGEQVILLPRHCHSREHHQVPAMKGDVLFQLCYQEGRLL